MTECDGRPGGSLERETWAGLYEFFLTEHERRLESVASLGISPGDLKALIRLTPGRPEPMGTLADTWRCDASTVTWVVDRLEKRGLVERRSHAGDRRVRVVMLSAEGERVRARLLGELHEPPDALSRLPTADLRILHRLSLRLCDADADAKSSTVE